MFGIGDDAGEPIPDPIEEKAPTSSPPETTVSTPLQGKWAKKLEKPKRQQRDTSFTMPKGYGEKQQQQQRTRKKKYRNINDVTDHILLPGRHNNDVTDHILLPGRHMCDCQV